MKKIIHSFLIILSIALIFPLFAQETELKFYDEILFYDGYNNLEQLANEIVPAPEGVIRLRTSLVTTKMSEEQLNLFGESITLQVIIKAACDNYDRPAHVNLAFVPKNAETYHPDSVTRIELGRFITPFMNKNRQPDTVPYLFNVDYLESVFKDINLRNTYDYWLELDVFGVPYAANTQVAGCADRNDVFYGSVSFFTSSDGGGLEDDRVFVPLFFKQRFNNYQEAGTDVIGQTTKSIRFSIDQNAINARFFLITSNHGANTGGEEYNRRWHYAYFDNEEVLTYKPGRQTCEPFRVYNTQSNGIYGTTSKTDAQWQSFSNWCPGDVIDTRVIELEQVMQGEHTFKIEVPDAVFTGSQGNFPLSLFFSAKAGELGIKESELNFVAAYPNPAVSNVTITGSQPVKEVIIYNLNGQKIYQGNNDTIYVQNFPAGTYCLFVELSNGHVATLKLVKQ
ncbi:MAG: T9SS type A sorting domain-containing protein [Bacteroidales bacterium]|jgi:hypothetical protein|nr:T9SS type A sorting domain-containing protein [Bacteroidales bacterium]